MASEQYLHGIESQEVDDGIRPIPVVETAIVGLIGTAPDADAAKFPLNEPVEIVGNPRKAADLDTTGNGLGTLKDAVDGIFDQAGATVVIVRVAEGVDFDETISNILGDLTAGTGVWAFLDAKAKVHLQPKVLIAPGFTSHRVNGGVISYNVTAGGSE